MESEPQTAWSKDQITTFLSVSSLYLVTMSVLYLWGYWSPFHINILEYMGLGDIVKAVAIPFASVVIVYLSTLAITELSPVRQLLPVGGGSDTPVGKTLNRWIAPIGFAYSCLLVVLVVRAQSRPTDWVVLPFLIAVPFGIILDRSAAFRRALPDHTRRISVAFVLSTLLPLAYGQGVMNASNVASARSFQYVVSAIEGINVGPDTPPTQRVRFLGHAGDYLFFLEPIKGSIAIEKIDGKNPPLVLRYFDAAKVEEAAARPASAPPAGAATAPSSLPSAATATHPPASSASAGEQPFSPSVAASGAPPS